MISAQHSCSALVRSTAVATSVSSGLRLLGARHAARQLRQKASLRQLRPLARIPLSHRMISTQGKPAEESTHTWGDKLVLFGLTLRGAALVPRLFSMAPMLRFAGGIPMLAGTVVTLYDIGGWKLLLGIPATTVALLTAGKLADNRCDENFRAEIIQDLARECPAIPSSVIEALEATSARQYETNRVRLELQCPADKDASGNWRIVAFGTRDHMSQRWCITSLEASHGVMETQTHLQGLPPPQTRFWDGDAIPIRWEMMYQKE